MEPIVGPSMESLLKVDKSFLQYVRIYADYLSLEERLEVIQVEYRTYLGISPPKECLFNYVNKRYYHWLDDWIEFTLGFVGEPLEYPASCYPQ
jgi:hypothetical protein